MNLKLVILGHCCLKNESDDKLSKWITDSFSQLTNQEIYSSCQLQFEYLSVGIHTQNKNPVTLNSVLKPTALHLYTGTHALARPLSLHILLPLFIHPPPSPLPSVMNEHARLTAAN